MAARNAFAGARAKLYFDGNTLAGWASNVSANENIARQRIDVLGEIDSQEIPAIGRSVTVTAGFVRIIGESLQQQGLWPSGGTNEVISFPEMSAEIIDGVDGETVLYRIEGLQPESRNWSVDRNSVVMTNVTWQAIRMTDGAE